MKEHTPISTARESRGMTLAHCARDLSIPETTLAAFERGDIAGLPPECFATGFLRTYCRYLGICEESHLQSLRKSFCDAAAEGDSRANRFLARIRKRLPALRLPLPPEIISWGVITAIILSAWVGYTLLVRPEADATATQASAATLELRLPESTTRD